jgi:hypothetical protein
MLFIIIYYPPDVPDDRKTIHGTVASQVQCALNARSLESMEHQNKEMKRRGFVFTSKRDMFPSSTLKIPTATFYGAGGDIGKIFYYYAPVLDGTSRIRFWLSTSINENQCA